jgi:hypothetical protein
MKSFINKILVLSFSYLISGCVITSPVTLPSALPTEENLQNQVIMFGNISRGRFFTQNICSGETQRFQNPLDIVDFIKWDENDCHLIGLTRTGYLDVTLPENDSKWIYQFDKLEEANPENYLIFPPLLSPDQNKIAYLSGRGQFFEGMNTSEYEYQDLIVNVIKDDLQKYRISSNGGARFIMTERYTDLFAVWSPNSQWIVFSDFDDKGLYQVYVSKFDGTQKQQITYRLTKDESPFDFSFSVVWSSSNEWLAIRYFDGIRKVKIINLNQESTDFEINNASPLWWTDNEELLIYSQGFQGIALFNPKTNQITKLIGETKDPFFLIGPYGSKENIGYFLYQSEDPLKSEFYVFDISKSVTKNLPYVKLPSEKTLFWFLIFKQTNDECN